MISRIFDVSGLLVVLGIAVLAFLLPVIVGAARGESGVLRGVEALILALLGGLISRTFISMLMGAAGDSFGAGLAVGWGFFLVPGLVDTFAGHAVLTTPDILMMLGGIIGAITGMMAGIYRIYDWEGLGWIAFPLDVTWALAGNTVAAIMHLANNTIWRDHADEPRTNVHRYASGIALRYDPPYAFTQGCVMSNLTDPEGSDLYRHERLHVWQNRAFGPLYTLTYVGWVIVWVIPSLIVGIAKFGLSGIRSGPTDWCYFNNPWEAWAYSVQGADRTNIQGVGEDDRQLIWPGRFVVAWAIPFFLICLGLSTFTAYQVWMAPTPPASHTAHPSTTKPLPTHKH